MSYIYTIPSEKTKYNVICTRRYSRVPQTLKNIIISGTVPLIVTVPTTLFELNSK